VDQGGQPIASGSIVTLRSAAADALLHGTPNGSAQVVADKSDFGFWYVEKSGGSSSSTSSPSQTEAKEDAGTDSNRHLKIGDVITLKAFNQKYLEVDRATGLAHCGNASRSSLAPVAEGSAASSAENPQSGFAGTGWQEFVIERFGMGLVKLNDSTIRRGHNICLKPVPRSEAEQRSAYVKVRQDGSVVADGKVNQTENGFIVDMGSMNHLVAPLGAALSEGDVDLLVAPLWNKSDLKHHDALSSAWTNDEELSKFKGAVVVANDQGICTVPKAKGEGTLEWVAVMNEGIDVRKAAEKAKELKATGLIIRCDQALSLEQLANRYEDGEPPCLPTVFVSSKVGEALKERGLVLKGCEFKKKHMTEVMRSLGEIGTGRGSSKVGRVFKSVGDAMIEEQKAKDAALAAQAAKPKFRQQVPNPAAGQSKFKWKVDSNTHYIWSGSGGGATQMKVNFGMKAPPSAHKQKVLADDEGSGATHIDASADIVPSADSNPELRYGFSERTIVDSAVIDCEEFKGHRLAAELEEVLMENEDEAHNQAREQLSDESDFMIEYNFAEVEVAITKENADPELEEDEEILDDSGAAIARIGVPRRHFWLIAFGLLFSTTAVTWLLLYRLQTELKIDKCQVDPQACIEDPETSFQAEAQILRFLSASQ